jgi:hypothetical protein
LENALSQISPQKVSVSGVALYTQPDGFTCGVTSISIVASFLQQKDIPPEALIEKYDLEAGMQADLFTEILKSELPAYNIEYKQNLSNTDLILSIHDQLLNSIPVPIFFGAANPYNEPYNDFHASVVTGLDLVTRQVTILNAYGYIEEISLDEFLNRMSYRPTRDYPLIQKAVLRLGLMDKNCIVQIART